MTPSRAPIEFYLDEDIGCLDLTTHALALAERPARIIFAARHPILAAGGEEAAAVLRTAGASSVSAVPDGRALAAGESLLSASGPARALFAGWKVAQNLLEYACGVATRTHDLVARARAVQPDIMVYTTRKTIPGSRALAVRAILAGGAYPHRLGLAETVLVFPQHLAFLGGVAGLVARLPSLRRALLEKKIVVEVDTLADAEALAQAGVDIVQFDKVSADRLRDIVPNLRAHAPTLKILAAGGIDAGTIAAFAATGVDGLVTSAPYVGTPADIRVTLSPASAVFGEAA